MAHTLTENATYDATITVPDDGDGDLAASVGGGPSDPTSGVGMQALANRTKYLNTVKLLITAANYLWSGGHRPTLQSSDANTTDIVIGAANGLIVNGVVLNAQTAQTLTPTVAADTWYYVYAYGPGSITYKGTDPTRRYVGCFRTDHAGGVLPFLMTNGRYVYRWSASSVANQFNVLAAGVATVSTTISLTPIAGGVAKLLPPHARHAILRATVSNTGTATGTCTVYTPSDTGTEARTFTAINTGTGASGNPLPTETFELETNTSQQVAYKTDNNGGTNQAALYLSVAGYQEP